MRLHSLLRSTGVRRSAAPTAVTTLTSSPLPVPPAAPFHRAAPSAASSSVPPPPPPPHSPQSSAQAEHGSTAPSPSAAAWAASHRFHLTPLSSLQRSLLFAGSSVLALLNPHRGDLVAAVGELTPGPLTSLPLQQLRERMMRTEEGRWILAHKPRINSTTLPLQQLVTTLPPDSFGAQYAKFMLDRGYTADGRSHVKYIPDPELAYVLQRYREIHDLLHVLTGLPTSVLGELGQKAFEAMHFRLSMPALSAVVAPPLTLSSAHRSFYYSTLLPWAKELNGSLKVEHLLGVRYELYLHRNLDDLRKEWGVRAAPQLPPE